MKDPLKEAQKMTDIIFSEWNLFGPWKEQKNVDYHNVLKVDRARRYYLSLKNSGKEGYGDILGECRVFLIEYFKNKLNSIGLEGERDREKQREIMKFVYLQERVEEDDTRSIKELEERYNKASERAEKILREVMEKGMI